jgi:small-conductance mechanosensitive channel
MEKTTVISRIWWIVLTGLILIVLVFFLTKIVSIVPVVYKPFTGDIQALLFGVILYIALRLILKTLQNYLERRVQKKYVRPLVFIISLIGYFVILLAVLALLGVDLSSIILGSAFAGAIVGLAAQQILSNFFSGVLLIWTRPFAPGEYIEFNSWQYSYMLPSYPPKYLSRDEFRWKIAGTVEDISMNFTTIVENDGTVTKIPNSIIIQGAITVNPVRNKIQVRTEMLNSVDYDGLKKRIESIASSMKEIKDFATSVEEIGRETYLVKITLTTEGGDSEAVRARFMEDLLAARKNI